MWKAETRRIMTVREGERTQFSRLLKFRLVPTCWRCTGATDDTAPLLSIVIWFLLPYRYTGPGMKGMLFARTICGYVCTWPRCRKGGSQFLCRRPCYLGRSFTRDYQQTWNGWCFLGSMICFWLGSWMNFSAFIYFSKRIPGIIVRVPRERLRESYL